MKINNEKIEIGPNEEVSWDQVAALRILNDSLIIELEDHRTVELKDLRQTTIDLAFRSYKEYLRDHQT